MLKNTEQRRNPPDRTTHGLRYTRLYSIWSGMRARCNNPRHSSYPDYGGRGIKICSEWSDVKVFYDWAVSNGYDDSLTLDRIDGNGNYQPDNCRWETQRRQQNNRRNNRFLTANNTTRTIAEWSRITGISHNVIWQRVLVNDWTPELAVSTPTREKRKNKAVL